MASNQTVEQWHNLMARVRELTQPASALGVVAAARLEHPHGAGDVDLVGGERIREGARAFAERAH